MLRGDDNLTGRAFHGRSAASLFPWRWFSLILLTAICLRLDGIERPFWLDEVWVVNSVLQVDLTAMFFYESWLQTTPPIFLLLLRWIAWTFGPEHEVLRLLPLAFSIVSIVLTGMLARSLLPAGTAVLIIALMALSETHVLYAKTLKQYSSDSAVAGLMLLAGWHYLEQRTTAALALALGTFIVLAGLSYNAVLFTPALLWGRSGGDPKSCGHPFPGCMQLPPS